MNKNNYRPQQQNGNKFECMTLPDALRCSTTGKLPAKYAVCFNYYFVLCCFEKQ